MTGDKLRISSEVPVLHPDNMEFKGGILGIGPIARNKWEIFHPCSLRKLA